MFFILCIQFVGMFALVSIENNNVIASNSELNLINYMSGVQVEGKANTDFEVRDDQIEGVKAYKGLYDNFVKRLDEKSDLYYIYNYCFYYGEEKELYDYYKQDSLPIRPLYSPIIIDDKNLCVGKCENLEDDEIIIGSEFANGKSVMNFNGVTLGVPFGGKEELLRQIEDYLKNNTLQIKAVDNSKFTEDDIQYDEDDVQESKFSIFKEGVSVFKDMKIVGVAKTIPSITVTYEENKVLSTANYLNINYEEKDLEYRFYNSSSLSNEDICKFANKKLVENQSFDHYYSVENDFSLKYTFFENNVISNDKIKEFSNNKIFSDLNVNFMYYNEDYFTVEKSVILFMDNIDIVLNSLYDKLSVPFDKEKHIITRSSNYENGSILNFFGKDYIVYGHFFKRINRVSVYDKTSHFLTKEHLDYFLNNKKITELNGGMSDYFTVYLKEPQASILGLGLAETNFDKIGYNVYRTIDSSAEQNFAEYLARKENGKIVTNAISITLVILLSIVSTVLVFALTFIIKKNFSVNTFKKKVYKMDILSPSILAGIVIFISIFTFFTKNWAYYIIEYDLMALVPSFAHFEFETQNKFNLIINSICLVVSIIFCIYLYLRNIEFKKIKVKK